MVHVHRSNPVGVTILGVVILLAIGAPGLFFGPRTAGAVAGFVVCALLAFGLAVLTSGRVECSLDASRRSLRLRALRWPLAPVERTLSLDAISRVEERRVQRNSRRVVFVMRDGAEVPLTTGGSSSTAHAETAAVLRRWLEEYRSR